MPRFIISWLDAEDGEILADEIVNASDRYGVIAAALEQWIAEEWSISGIVSFLCAFGDEELPLTEDDVEFATDERLSPDSALRVAENRRILANMVLDLIRDNGIVTDEFLTAVKDSLEIHRDGTGEAMDVES